MANSLREIVARNIKAERIKRGLTQGELARKAKLTDVYVSRIEKTAKNITLDSLEQLSAALGVPVDQLIADKGRRSVSKPKSEDAKSLKNALKVLEEYIRSLQQELT